MGLDTRVIPFFSADIKIKAHTCNDLAHLERAVSIREFSQGQPVSLEQDIETGDLIAYTSNLQFIYGPEA
jgi:hypothetical protein